MKETEEVLLEEDTPEEVEERAEPLEILYRNGTFITVGDSGTVLNSSDGSTWTSVTSGKSNDLWGILY